MFPVANATLPANHVPSAMNVAWGPGFLVVNSWLLWAPDKCDNQTDTLTTQHCSDDWC